MKEEAKIRGALFRTFLSLMLCLSLIALKYIFREEELVADICNYLLSDIVFMK